MAVALATVVFLVWLFLTFFRGDFWRAEQRLPQEIVRLPYWPEVVAIVPARNEAQSIGHCVQGLLRQDYPGIFRVIVVDDQSQDGTASLAEEAARRLGADERLQVLSGSPLPQGWAGKVWAMAQGVEAAGSATYLWFTDADIEHGPRVLQTLLAKAENEQRVLVSLMVRLSTTTLWERWLIPAFLFFFQKLYPFPWVNDPQHQTAAAAGGCMLVRREVLAQSGGLAEMRGALIDDCTLAAQLKPLGAIWLGLADDSLSLRQYQSLGEIWRMVARSAYVQLQHRPSLLLGTTLGMLILYFLPWALLVLGLLTGMNLPAIILAAGTLLISWWIYWPTLRYLQLSPLWVLSLQPAAWLYTLMTLDSARQYYAGRGGAWKGRTYS